MKRSVKFLAILAKITLCVFLFVSSAEADSTANSLIEDAIEVLNEMSRQEDASSMGELLQDARAVAFVPGFVKAGFIIGGEYGEGLILRREGKKWYGPSFYNLGGGSVGLQIGAQKISFVLVITNEAGVDAFLKSRTKLGGDVAIAAGPVGRRGEAATDGQMKASIYSYSLTKGLFAGVSLDGSVISVSVKRNKEYWKKETSADQALKNPATDKRIQPLIRAIEKVSKAKKK
ncbi:MAG: lipid-binding SYLF domain-containing protein [Synergistaceae bacterium]|jgi:lipid-binding SYLF domain-containing protein|nr:lipid-binding SYLF domain-containing protein [Synergistaceae bacterium]